MCINYILRISEIKSRHLIIIPIFGDDYIQKHMVNQSIYIKSFGQTTEDKIDFLTYRILK